MRKAVYIILFSVLILNIAVSAPQSASKSAPQTASPPSGWDLLRKIVLIPGLSSQEGKVSDFIQAALPSSLKVQRDAKSNVWFTVGDGKPHILFVAHLDELGFLVDKITPQGTVLLRVRGGLLPQTCEARPFVIHTAKGPVEGVIQPKPDYYLSQTAAASPARAAQSPAQMTSQPLPVPAAAPAPSQKPPQAAAQPAPKPTPAQAKAPAQAPAKPQGQAPAAEPVELYLGCSSEQEVRALGVAEGDQVLFKKRLVDLAPDILATRAVDDRAGCAALLAAALRLDWTKIKTRTITFAWDVEEETGLNGAQLLAKTLKPDYVFAIDTFVSTDSPLENKRFGYAVLGKGAVLRSIDTSNVTPKIEIRKVARIAEGRKIPIQIRNSRGGNDGSVFVADGAADIPLSWAGAYAHSFIEKIVKSDLEALTDLIAALVEEWK
ncbi:MAG: M20/M25/M40 family metallo-hydrolase [Candidatus Aminicenantes bacterium]|nr:M20/M25/M40 family metallo-hydrolase [Candidatus Aminicenantes bacterium]